MRIIPSLIHRYIRYFSLRISNIATILSLYSIFDAVNSNLQPSSTMCNIEYALQKVTQNDHKTRNFEFKVLKKAVYSNIRGPPSPNFEYTELRY
jgi:hypothetical protein